VTRQHDEAAGGAMIADHAGEARDTVVVERRRRLVQQPERRRRCQQARERDAPALAGREQARRQLGKAIKTERRERAADGGGVAQAVQLLPQREVLQHGQRRLHRVLMAEIAQAAAVGIEVERHRLIVPGLRAHGRHEQAGHAAQQARLAAAVWPAQQQGRAGGDAERESAEDETLAAPTRQVVAGEEGHASIESTTSPRLSKQAATSGPPKPQPPSMLAVNWLVWMPAWARSKPRTTRMNPP
jgi:hypothetical protein